MGLERFGISYHHLIFIIVLSIISFIASHLCACTGCGKDIIAGDAGADDLVSEDPNVDVLPEDEGEADPNVQDEPWPDEVHDEGSLEDPEDREDPEEEIEVPAPPYWAESMGGTGYERPYIIELASDGGFIVAGWSGSFGAVEFGAWILKLDSLGTILWQKTLLMDADMIVGSLRVTADGGFIAVGGSMVDSHPVDMLVLKFDPDGHVVWQKAYGGVLYRSVSGIRQTADGGYVVTGSIYPPEESASRALIVRLDAVGDIVWEKEYRDDDWASAGSIEQTPDEGFMVGGTVNDLSTSDVLVMKVGADGNVEWQKAVGGPSSDSGGGLHGTPDGAYIVSGMSYSFHGGMSGNSDGWFFKIDPAGNIVWQGAYDMWSTDGIVSVDVTADGGFIMGGVNYDAESLEIVLRVDPFGRILWQKTYGDNAGSAVRQTADGGFILGGSADLDGTGLTDFLILKVDEMGVVSESCPPGFGEESFAAVLEASAIAVDATLTAGDVHLVVADADIAVVDTSVAPVVHCRR